MLRSSFFAAALSLMSVTQPTLAAPVEKLEITTSTGRHVLEVEVMRSEADREHGLMFRKSMSADHGMLFDFKRPQIIYMWMKNTVLPLDMIFIDGRGSVVNVARDTVPLSETVIPSGALIVGVLEVNAGIAKTLSLKNGDKVEHPIFKD